MECDFFIHAKIEQNSKYVPIFTPEGCCQVIQTARTKPQPFQVMPLCHDDFVDVSEGKIVFENPENANKTSNHLPFKKAIWFQYRTTDPDAVFVRSEYAEDAPFMKYVAKVNKNKRGRPSINSKNALQVEVPNYTKKVESPSKTLYRSADSSYLP